MAIECQDIGLAIQPAYNIESNKIEYAEVLIRRLEDMYGAASILELITSQKKETEFDLAVLRKSLKYISEIKPDFAIGVNLMGKTLEEPDISDKIMSLIKEYEIDTKSLIIEINEETNFSSKEVIKNIMRLRNNGIRLALDDFGSSKANLNALILNNQNPFSIIKVDKQFVDDIDKNIRAKTDMLNILYIICRYTNVSSIVEGIETERQLDVIKTIGFNIVQGYLFGKPTELYKFRQESV